MAGPNDKMLVRVVLGQGAIPLPRALKRLLTRFDPRPRRVDPKRLTDAQLAALGLDRETLSAAREAEWDPPGYWLNSNRRDARC